MALARVQPFQNRLKMLKFLFLGARYIEAVPRNSVPALRRMGTTQNQATNGMVSNPASNLDGRVPTTSQPTSEGTLVRRPVSNTVFGQLPTTVFEEMSRLAAEHKSINLGQGFPDDELEGPEMMKAVASSSLYDYSNQYPPLMGVPELRQAVAAHSMRHARVPPGDVLITLGATEGLASAFMGLLNRGDEVGAHAHGRAIHTSISVCVHTPRRVLAPLRLASMH